MQRMMHLYELLHSYNTFNTYKFILSNQKKIGYNYLWKDWMLFKAIIKWDTFFLLITVGI